MGFINSLVEWFTSLAEKEHIASVAVVGIALGILLASLLMLFLIVYSD